MIQLEKLHPVGYGMFGIFAGCFREFSEGGEMPCAEAASFRRAMMKKAPLFGALFSYLDAGKGMAA